MSPSPLTGNSGTLDWLGVGGSMTCALHCALVPVVVLALPAIGASWLVSEQFARAMIGVSTTVALLSLIGGFRLHANAGPFVLAGAGIALLVGGEVVEGDLVRGAVMDLTGGLFVAGAHFLNRSPCLACPACSIESALSAGPCHGGGRIESAIGGLALARVLHRAFVRSAVLADAHRQSPDNNCCPSSSTWVSSEPTKEMRMHSLLPRMLVAWSLVLPPPTIAQQREPLSVGSVTAVPGTAASGYIRVAPAAGDNGTAVVTDWLGEQISVIVSPNDGVVMYQAVTPPISAGETVTAVGVPLTRAASR